MLNNTHERRIFPFKDSPIPLFPNNPDSIKWKVTTDIMLGKTSSPDTQERAEIDRVLGEASSSGTQERSEID